MSRSGCQGYWLTVLLAGSQLFCASLLAQAQFLGTGVNSSGPFPSPLPSPQGEGALQPGVTNSPASHRANAGAPSLPAMLPIPSPKSPVELFRELLAMNFSERRQFLTNRPPASQKLILAKVREYESLKPDQREWRLKATELRWYLLPFMKTAAADRRTRLEQIPPEDRKLVEDRLQEWDKLPPNVQKELLDNEAMIQHLTEQKQGIAQNISPARREMLEKGVAQWQQLPEEQRRNMVDRFNRFFDLTSQEKQKVLGRLSDSERRQIEKTLRSFGALSPAKRAQCIHSFEQFTGMSVEERQQFLKNAERWKLMTPNERQAWRQLVSQMPLMPPQPNILPMPPGPPSSRRSRSVATNGG
jgi:hypothetical protein